MLFHILAFALMVAASLIYGSSLGWRQVAVFWAAFIVASVLGSMLHAPGVSLLFRLAIAIAMLVRGRMGSRSFS